MTLLPPTSSFSPSLLSSSPKPKPNQTLSVDKPHHLISLIQICRTRQELSQTHCLLVKTASVRGGPAFARLLLSFASLPDPASLSHARKLFDRPHRPKSPFAYNALIRHSDPITALSLFSDMMRDASAAPDDFTFTFVCSACSKSPSLASVGKQVHALMVKTPTAIKTQSWNSLMVFYLKSAESLPMASRIFYEIDEPDVVTWNCLLDGHVKFGDLEGAERVFDEMPSRDSVSWTTMLVGYSNAGLASQARRLFDEMPNRTMVSWSAMISGYVKSGMYAEALTVFGEMQESGVRIDRIALTSLLSACAKLGALDQGRWIHAYIDKQRVETDAQLRTGLVDMYAKCGQIDLAYRVFRESRDKKVFLWNAVLGGLAMHSCGKKAVELFSEMLKTGTKPNEITFVCVLSACSHSGLIDDGLRIFYSMEGNHKITPAAEHYGCIVDLLGRAGLVDEAKMAIQAMPMSADANIWRSLLGACAVHGNVELGRQVGRVLLELEPLDDGNYVLLSNVYAMNGRWEDVGRLRSVMKRRDVKKSHGWSFVEVNGLLHVFVAGDWSHPQSSDIYLLLHHLTEHISTCGPNWIESSRPFE